MPELPEVETIRRQIAPALAGKRIVDTWHAPNRKSYRQAMSSVTACSR